MNSRRGEFTEGLGMILVLVGFWSSAVSGQQTLPVILPSPQAVQPSTSYRKDPSPAEDPAPRPPAPISVSQPGRPATLSAQPEAPTPLPPDTYPVAEPTPGREQNLPAGRQVPAVSLEWVGPVVARVGISTPYQIVARNKSNTPVHQVMIRARVPEGVEVQATEPRASNEENVLVWVLGTLKPREEKRMDVLLIPKNAGEVSCQASVTFTGRVSMRMQVHEPKLEVKLNAPQTVIAGDPARVTAMVHNPGDATLEGIKLRATLSEGLEHVQGKTIEFNLGHIPPRESRNALILCGTRGAGSQSCAVTASSRFGLTANDEVTFEVLAPRLEVKVKAPRMRYLGRRAPVLISVANTGTAVAHGVSISNQIPRGFRVVRLTNGGGLDYATRRVSWYLGTLEAGKTREVAMSLVATHAGQLTNVAKVTGARGVSASAEATTRVEGLSALLMELIDLDDPIEVGAETSYEIRVTNTGTKTETNLQLACTIPEEMEFLAARGAAGTQYRMMGRDVVFQALPRLAPRADAIYRIQVRSLRAGDVRFQARIQADGLKVPVLKEESTRLYGDEIDPAFYSLPRSVPPDKQ